jgi:hypothetical protein
MEATSTGTPVMDWTRHVRQGSSLPALSVVNVQQMVDVVNLASWALDEHTGGTCGALPVSAVVPSTGAAASVEVFCFFREEKKLVTTVLLMTLVLSMEKEASSSSSLLFECVSVSAALPSARDAAASVEVFCFLFLFVEREKKLVIMVLFMKPVVWIEKDMNERQDSKVDDDDDVGRCALLISTFTMAH